MTYKLPYWYDLHAHFRQGPAVKQYLQAHLNSGCAGILAMPNTQPPISRVIGTNNERSWSIESYRQMIFDMGGDRFNNVIVPLYLTAKTTAHMIEEGSKSGLLKACKYYPPHGTTNSSYGVPLQTYMENGVFSAMQEHGVILCVHGEEHGLSGESYFGKNSKAEDFFYRERLPLVSEKFPQLKIVCEHITTKTAATFVKNSDKTYGKPIINIKPKSFYTSDHLS